MKIENVDTLMSLARFNAKVMFDFRKEGRPTEVKLFVGGFIHPVTEKLHGKEYSPTAIHIAYLDHSMWASEVDKDFYMHSFEFLSPFNKGR